MFLISSFAVSLVAIPTANAHTPPWKIATFAHVVAVPDPIGVNQTTYIYVFLANPPFDGAAVTNDYRYHNYIVTITAPDESINKTTFDYVSDPTGNNPFKFTPTQVGTYTINFTFPGQDYTEYSYNPASAYVNDTYLPSSEITTLTVQQEPIPLGITTYPLPSEYWTRPIYGENTDWWSISSNWLGQGAAGYFGVDAGGYSNLQVYPGDAVGPRTAHVMWTKPLQSGGVVGGNNFAIQGDTYFEGSAYLQRFANPIVVNGRLYYTEPLSFSGAPNGGFGSPTAYGPTDCVDLRTGQLIWSRMDVPPLSFGYIYSVQDENQKGVYPAILFAVSGFGAQTWRAFDADTGTPLFNATGVPSVTSGTLVMGPQGEQLRYVLANAGNTTNHDWRLGEWNSSKLWAYTYPPNLSPTLSGMVTTPTGTAVDASISNPSDPNNRYDWNYSLTWANSMPLPPPSFFNPSPPPFNIMNVFYNNMIICRNGSLPAPGTGSPYTYFAINLNASKGPIGSVLWWNTVNPPEGNQSVLPGGADPTVNVFVEAYRETVQWVGYSMTDGHKMWGPTPSQTPLDYFGNTGVSYVQGALAYGKLYSGGYGGTIYCYDLTTGDVLWTYGNGGEGNNTNSNFYVPGPYPTFITAIGKGVVYLITSAHTATNPIYKGALTRAIDAETGQEIWTLSDYTSELAAPFSSPKSYVIADGFAAFFNGYDNQIYSVGRGPSVTTVSAPEAGLAFDQSIVIRGTVMDVSAGTKQDEQAARFAKGVPAVSDDSMTEWMGYIYQQRPFPSNCTGVPITIDVMDSNNNYRTIGTPTSDGSGTFSLTWTPDIPGNFTVIATFKGSNAYWPSYAETSFTVMNPPEATPAPTPTPAQMTDTYVIGFGSVLIIVVAIGFALLLLKKR